MALIPFSPEIVSSYKGMTALMEALSQRCLQKSIADVRPGDRNHPEIQQLPISGKMFVTYCQRLSGSTSFSVRASTLDILVQTVSKGAISSWDDWQKINRETHARPPIEKQTGTFPSDPVTLFSNFKLKKGRIIASVILALVLLLIGVVFFRFSFSKQNFTETFDLPDLNSLTQNGWRILDFDSTLWHTFPPRAGALTLATARGDIWVQHYRGQRPMIKNFLVRKLDSGQDFEATVHISDFYPDQQHQQAGIILLNDTLQKSTFMRLTVTRNYLQEGGTPLFTVQVVISIDGEIIYTSMVDQKKLENLPSAKDRDLLYKDIWLRISHAKGRYTFAHRFYFPSRPFTFIKLEGVSNTGLAVSDLPKLEKLQPRFVGLAAFHGITTEDNHFLNADTIPVRLNEFILQEL